MSSPDGAPARHGVPSHGMHNRVEIRPVDPDGPEARHCMAEYYAELDRRFDGGFDPAASLPAPPDDLVPPRGVFLVAAAGTAVLGSGALRVTAPGIGSIKRMWVDASARGLGLGRGILAALEDEARRLGLHTLRLETNAALVEAIRLYRSAGFSEVPPFNDDPYADHWFEKIIEP